MTEGANSATWAITAVCRSLHVEHIAKCRVTFGQHAGATSALPFGAPEHEGRMCPYACMGVYYSDADAMLGLLYTFVVSLLQGRSQKDWEAVEGAV